MNPAQREPHGDRSQGGALERGPRTPQLQQRAKTPRPDEVRCIGVPSGMCLRCGLIGRHRDALACIDALRDLLADRDFQLAALRGQRVRESASSRRRKKESKPTTGGSE